MAEIFIALGSNLGDRLAYLARARDAFAPAGINVIAASSIYETDPWGPVPQDPYLNQVVRADTSLSPHELLTQLHAIERSLGRDRAREARNGPRNIDLDILVYDGIALKDADLEIPHPRMMQRSFVLVPLAEIAPELTVNGVAIRSALARAPRSGITRYDDGTKAADLADSPQMS